MSTDISRDMQMLDTENAIEVKNIAALVANEKALNRVTPWGTLKVLKPKVNLKMFNSKPLVFPVFGHARIKHCYAIKMILLTLFLQCHRVSLKIFNRLPDKLFNKSTCVASQWDPEGVGGENSWGLRYGQRTEGKTGGAPTESKSGTTHSKTQTDFSVYFI